MIARWGRSIVAFFDGVGRVAGVIAGVVALALSIFGGIHLADEADPDPSPRMTACSDGRDNDGDGLIDFSHDPQCSSRDDRSERDPACSDGKDNDGDGLIDFSHDPDCSSRDDRTEQNPACSDGRDNDHDGEIDFRHDPDCSSPEDHTEKRSAGVLGGARAAPP